MPEEKPPPGEIALIAITIFIVGTLLAQMSRVLLSPFNETYAQLSRYTNESPVFNGTYSLVTYAISIILKILGNPVAFLILIGISLLLYARSTRW